MKNIEKKTELGQINLIHHHQKNTVVQLLIISANSGICN